MVFDPEIHHRHSVRVRGYDYSQPGAYFVTICELRKQCIFGQVRGAEVELNRLGEMVRACWLWLGKHYEYVFPDEWIVMPNHLHGIVVIQELDEKGEGRHVLRYPGDSATNGVSAGGSRTAPTNVATVGSHGGGSRSAPTRRKPLGSLIGAFKTVSTKRVNELRGTPSAVLWQRSYYEHIVRNEVELGQIRQYIRTNPLMWHSDPEYL